MFRSPSRSIPGHRNSPGSLPGIRLKIQTRCPGGLERSHKFCDINCFSSRLRFKTGRFVRVFGCLELRAKRPLADGFHPEDLVGVLLGLGFGVSQKCDNSVPDVIHPCGSLCRSSHGTGRFRAPRHCCVCVSESSDAVAVSSVLEFVLEFLSRTFRNLLSPLMSSHLWRDFLIMVGAAGFEPTASSSRTRRATRLRYAPTSTAFPGQFRAVKSNRDFRPRCKWIFRTIDRKSGIF